MGGRMGMTRRIAVAALAVGSLMGSAASAAQYSGNADDFAQISQLFARYSATLDARDPQGWLAIFTPKGIFHGGGFCAVGRAELTALVEKVRAGAAKAPPNRPKGHHVPSLGPIDYVDRDHATVHSFVMVVTDMARGGGTGGITVTGSYDDKLERVGGRWLFADRLEISPGDAPEPPCPRTP